MAENAGSKWWSKDTVAVVTGSCRGIGREILHQLANEGITVVMTDISSAESMQTSVEALRAELQLQSVNSGLNSAATGVFWHPLDIRSDKSVEDLTNWLKKEFVDGIDILVNNAAIIDTGEIKYEVAKDIVDTNFWGTKRVTEALLPLMRRTSTAGARIISVTSRAGTYERLTNESAKAKLSDLTHLSFEVLDNLALEYLEDVKADRLEEAEWIPRTSTSPFYSVSKMLVSAYVHILASSLESEDGNSGAIFVTALCPGATDTAMLNEAARKKVQGSFKIKSVEEAADTPVWLALFPKEGYPRGRLFAEREEFPYNLKLPSLYTYSSDNEVGK